MGLRLAIKVAYFSITEFSHGFQIQHDVETIFGFLQKAFEKAGFLDKNENELDYAGRTDHGVNAICQVIAINLNEKWNSVPERLLHRVNANLPKNIRCWAYAIVSKDFHPRFNALERSYTYIYTPIKAEIIDVSLMRKACLLLEGTHDLTNFSKKGNDSLNQIR